jgi:hypothetical protein
MALPRLASRRRDTVVEGQETAYFKEYNALKQIYSDGGSIEILVAAVRTFVQHQFQESVEGFIVATYSVLHAGEDHAVKLRRLLERANRRLKKYNKSVDKLEQVIEYLKSKQQCVIS